MITSSLTKRIDLLPAELQQQVADFVDFLILKYQVGKSGKEEFSAQEKEELMRIWEEYQQNPDDVQTLEEAEKQTLSKYAL
jgi:hypothetical protein